MDMMMFDIVDLAPALKFTAVRENEPAKQLSDITANIFCFFQKIAAEAPVRMITCCDIA
jgi:hypothetical protein